MFSWLRLFVCFALLVAIAYVTRDIVLRSVDQQVRKYDHADISHMKYGLFSVNIWKKKIARVVVNEIQNFKVDESNKETLKKHIEAQLDGLIDKVNEQIKESNKDSTKGWIKQKLMDMLVDVKVIKQGIPTYADTIVNQMTEDKTQGQFKEIIKKKVTKYLEKTFEKQDTSEVDVILQRNGASNIDEGRELLMSKMVVQKEILNNNTEILIGLAVLLFVFSTFHRGKKMPAPYFFICLSALMILLFAGVTCPMIDMEAKISKFGFVLLGYNIEFLDQTVYFQSKSILDVFWIMITHAKIEMRFVGVLLILFSIVFPVLKLISSIFYYYNVFGAQKNWVFKALVLKSGKWSMTDVQVVAILMAYIGFNGMVTTQMKAIAATVPEMTFISTNGTTLQIGFFIFLTYAILAMIFSSRIVVENIKPAA
jgi:hypothetical protein